MNELDFVYELFACSSGMRANLIYEGGVGGPSSWFDVKVNSMAKSRIMKARYSLISSLGRVGDWFTHPSRTAFPNGRVELLPPKNKSQIWSANDSAWLSDENWLDPVAPPRLMVTILPAAWHISMSDARAEQFGSSVPGKVALSVGLHVWKGNLRSLIQYRGRNTALTFARLIDGSPPVPKKTFRNATGKALITLSEPQ